jgi:hypothetical protein
MVFCTGLDDLRDKQVLIQGNTKRFQKLYKECYEALARPVRNEFVAHLSQLKDLPPDLIRIIFEEIMTRPMDRLGLYIKVIKTLASVKGVLHYDDGGLKFTFIKKTINTYPDSSLSLLDTSQITRESVTEWVKSCEAQKPMLLRQSYPANWVFSTGSADKDLEAADIEYETETETNPLESFAQTFFQNGIYMLGSILRRTGEAKTVDKKHQAYLSLV